RPRHRPRRARAARPGATGPARGAGRGSRQRPGPLRPGRGRACEGRRRHRPPGVHGGAGGSSHARSGPGPAPGAAVSALAIPPRRGRAAIARAACALAAIAALIAWRGRAPSGQGASVLLVTIDTLRADHVGAYGARTGATPHLDALAARGALFDEAL